MAQDKNVRSKKAKKSKPVGIIKSQGTFKCRHPGCTYRSKSLTNVRKHYARENHPLKPKKKPHKLNLNTLKRRGIVKSDATDEDIAMGAFIIEAMRDPYKMRAAVDELLEEYLDNRRPRGS